MNDGSDRKSFQELPGDENPQFTKDGIEIYLQMRKKYPENTCKDLDNILNGICAALHTLVINHVSRDDHKQFLQLIYKILNSNI